MVTCGKYSESRGGGAVGAVAEVIVPRVGKQAQAIAGSQPIPSSSLRSIWLPDVLVHVNARKLPLFARNDVGIKCPGYGFIFRQALLFD